MWAKSLIIIFAIFLTSSKACDINQSCDINMDDPDVQLMKQSMDTFSIALMNAMYGDTTLEGNATFSPPNVYVALFLLLIGTADGAKNEIIAALGLAADQDFNRLSGVLAAIVIGLEVLNTKVIRQQEITVENLSLGEVFYVQTGVNLVDKFTELLQSLDADSFPEDFSRNAAWATKKINQWINNQTGKRTPVTINTTLDPSTRVFVATAPFFSAKWEDNFFDPAQNGLGTFSTANGQVNVIFMTTAKTLWYLDDGKTFAAVQLPFENKAYMLHIIKPYGTNNPGDFVKAFNWDIWNAIVTQSKETPITVKIPKLAVAWTNEINEQLQALKIKEIFQGANFPHMIDYADGKLHVSAFTQSAGITINEVGVSMPDITPPSTNPVLLNNPINPSAFVMDTPCLLIVRNIRSGLIVLSSFVRQL